MWEEALPNRASLRPWPRRAVVSFVIITSGCSEVGGLGRSWAVGPGARARSLLRTRGAKVMGGETSKPRPVACVQEKGRFCERGRELDWGLASYIVYQRTPPPPPRLTSVCTFFDRDDRLPRLTLKVGTPVLWRRPNAPKRLLTVPRPDMRREIRVEPRQTIISPVGIWAGPSSVACPASRRPTPFIHRRLRNFFIARNGRAGLGAGGQRRGNGALVPLKQAPVPFRLMG